MADQDTSSDVDTSKAGAPNDSVAAVALVDVVEAPRDERTDSIDPATGALTDEAVALRRMAALVAVAQEA